VASYLSGKHGIPLITSICGGEAAEIPEINYGSRLKFFQKKFVNKAFKNAKVIVSGSDYITGKIQSYYSTSIAAKTRKIPFGVDEKMFYPFKTEAENKSGIKLINIATAFPVKAHKDLFRALKIVIEKYPDTILECYGSDEKNILKDIVNALGLNNNVKLNGLIDYEKVPSALNDAHIFVLSSLYESQNLAMLEAAFCGLPVVSTDVGIAPEITPHIVTPGDYKALAEKILHVIVNYSEEKKRALGKTEEIRNRFSSRSSAKKFHELYTSLITV
jgi:glycosyltransferase involved in cell wall biosynthesis